MKQQRLPLFDKNLQFYKFGLYGFLKNQRFFDPFLMLFFLEKGMTFFQIGVLYAVREIGTNLLEIPSGFLSDALGRRRTLASSFIFYIFSFAIFYFFSSYSIFIGAMLCYSVGEAFRSGTHKAMIFTYLKEMGWSKLKVHYYGHTRSWSQMGSAVSSLIAAFIVFYTGEIRYVFLCSIVPYILDLILILSYPKFLDGEIKLAKDISTKEKFKDIFSVFLQTFKNPIIFKATNNLSLYDGFFKAVKDYLQPVLSGLALTIPMLPFLTGEERSATIIGLAYFVIFLLTSFASRNAGIIADKFSSLSKAMNITLLFGLTLGLICGAFYQIGWLLLTVLFFVGIYLMENIRKPAGVAFIADRIDSKVLTSTLSATSQAKTIWAALISVCLGFLIDQFGLGWALMSVSVGLILMVPFVWLKRLPQQE